MLLWYASILGVVLPALTALAQSTKAVPSREDCQLLDETDPDLRAFLEPWANERNSWAVAPRDADREAFSRRGDRLAEYLLRQVQRLVPRCYASLPQYYHYLAWTGSETALRFIGSAVRDTGHYSVPLSYMKDPRAVKLLLSATRDTVLRPPTALLRGHLWSLANLMQQLATDRPDLWKPLRGEVVHELEAMKATPGLVEPSIKLLSRAILAVNSRSGMGIHPYWCCDR